MGIYRLAVELVHPALQGQAVNIWHLRTDDDVTEATADAAMNALHAFYDATNDIRAGGSVARWLGEMNTVGTDSETITPGTPWSSTTGTSAAPLPGSTAMCIGWKSDSGGRSGKGRSFISPVSTGANGPEGKPTPAAITALRNGAQALVNSSSSANGWAFGVYSRQDGLLRDFTGASIMGRFAVITSRRD